MLASCGIVHFRQPPLQESSLQLRERNLPICAAEICEIPKMPADPTGAEARSRTCMPHPLTLASPGASLWEVLAGMSELGQASI